MSSIICPRCNESELLYPITFNAISIHDNSTHICKHCGHIEARINYYEYKKSLHMIPKSHIEIENSFRKKLDKPVIIMDW